MSIIYEALKRVEGRSRGRSNRRINSKKLILPLLIVIAGITFFYSSTRNVSVHKSLPATVEPKASPAKTVAPEKPQASLVPEPKTLISKRPQTLIKSNRPQDLMVRDPFAQNPKTQHFKLSGIIYSPDKPMAIVNSKTVSIGQMIDKAKVSDIREESVELSLNDEKIILTLE